MIGSKKPYSILTAEQTGEFMLVSMHGKGLMFREWGRNAFKIFERTLSRMAKRLPRH
jgi:hypothetical protein